MVSNLVSMMPSIRRGSPVPYAVSLSAWLNFVTWSIESFPTSASPTNSTKSGLLRLTSLESARMRGSLSCMRPAVSTSTTSYPFCPANLTASMAIDAASLLYPFSYTGTSRRAACVLSCSTAPLRKVSQAASITFSPWLLSQKHTLERDVDLPTPLTPTNTHTYGRPLALHARTSRSTSMLCLGVRMRVRPSSRAPLTAFLTPLKPLIFFPSSEAATLVHSLSAMSNATFFVMSISRNCESTGARSSCVSAREPVMFCRYEKNPFLALPPAAGAASSSSSPDSTSQLSTSATPLPISARVSRSSRWMAPSAGLSVERS
mmetsp:Transcript_2938/g.7275  ORF Transcript_2938/g.7275 Transcript_2938/m.7275 type:complete len:318 (-) Transcript_2938:76-1029(-)